jgi:AcrR family transcriptional regulator
MARAVASRRLPLTEQRIVETAIRLIDADGLEALSMRHLGAALGVEAMALYRYFPSKNALLESVAARLLSQLRFPEAGGGRWQDSVRALARDYRALLLKHPNAIPIMATLQLTNPGALGAAGAVMSVLRAAGFGAQVSFHVLATAVSYIIGSAQWEAGTMNLRENGAPPQLPPGADPYIAENWAEIAGADCTIAFEFGLDVLIAGLERLRDGPQTGS